MNPMQSILVHMDASPRSGLRLELARQLAREHGANMLCALLAIEPRLVPMLTETVLADLPPPLVPEVDPDQLARARSIFDRALEERADPPMAWDVVPGDPPASGFAQAAQYADLMMLGQKDPKDPYAFDVPDDFVEDVLQQSGKPGLVIPYAGEFRTVGTNVLVAWKPSRECARAVAAAVPLMQRARSVAVVCWGEENFAPAETTFGIGRYLLWHGITAKVQRYPDEPDDIGAQLLSRAADAGADLLVMGCYGHSRLREIVLGGATREVMRSMTCPVLMAH